MRNYIILNNKNSNTISGLIIQELAPISKPLQRTQVETIDGRDGDIVTPLGYAAYNKKIKIGLYGNFDINEVIAYFATKGTVIFSNEPDKYYYYQIVDQIDYERLVRYRVATVTMHVQPFKYSATEGTITVDTSDTVSGEGSDIALDGTAEAPFNTLRHKGNATQTTYTGKNLFNKDATPMTLSSGTSVSALSRGVRVSYSSSSAVTSARYATYLIGDVSQLVGKNIIAKTNMSASALNGTRISIGLCKSDGSDRFTKVMLSQSGSIYYTITSEDVASRPYCYIYIYVNADGTAQQGDYADYTDLQIEISDNTTPTDYEPYVGNLPSPSPDYPQDIQVVTGDSEIEIRGKNLFNFEEFAQDKIKPSGVARGTATYTGNSITITATANDAYTRYGYNQGYPPIIKAPKNTDMVLSWNTSTVGTYKGLVYIFGVNANGGADVIRNNQDVAGKITFNTGDYDTISFRLGVSTAGNSITYSDIQLEIGNTPTAYEPYKEQSYVIPFGDTYLAKIGNYVDEPVKVDGTWYIRRAIGKVVFDGTETWSLSSNTNLCRTDIPDALVVASSSVIAPAVSDYFTASTWARLSDGTVDYGLAMYYSAGRIALRNKNFTTKNDYTTWLGTHNTTVYYALATPTDEEITDQDLIDALDELYDQAHSYKGHTHITATAADGNAPAVLAVDVNEDNESTVTNAGNTTSRPILTIYGQGDIGVYINDVEVLDVALGDEGYITLDSVEMEAYKDTTANLKNRLVTGDYSKLALNAGANKIRFTGKVTKYEISKYSRWL